MAENHAGQEFPLWVPVLFRYVFPHSFRENRIRKIVTWVSPDDGPLDFVERLVGVLPVSGRIDWGRGPGNRNNSLAWLVFRRVDRFLHVILELVGLWVLLKFATKEWDAGQDGQ